MRKDERISADNNIIRVMTNSRTQWQKTGGGGGGGGGGRGGKKGKGGKDGKAGNFGVAATGTMTKRERDTNALLTRLKRSSDRQGKSKGGKGTGQV